MLEGKWVKIDMKEMERTAAEMGAEPGAKPSPEPTLDARTQQQLLEALRETIAREVDFKSAGDKDGSEHITATAPFRTLITEFFDEIRPLAKRLPPGAEMPTAKDFKDAPNTKVTADFTLVNGELTEVYVDLAKLAEDAKVKKLGLVVRMSEGQAPTAPAGATELNMDEILGGFGAAMMEAEGVGEEGLLEEDFTEDAA
ncbi:hypothetical protein [Streptomyces pharetrae]|uniref:hypothetical protein n=1 Tax=Streptomyces pharetrae TaxID=291370 RepID=UPI0026A5EB48